MLWFLLLHLQKTESQAVYANSYSVKLCSTSFSKTTTYVPLRTLLPWPPNYIPVVKQADMKNVLFFRSWWMSKGPSLEVVRKSYSMDSQRISWRMGLLLQVLCEGEVLAFGLKLCICQNIWTHPLSLSSQAQGQTALAQGICLPMNLKERTVLAHLCKQASKPVISASTARWLHPTLSRRTIWLY